MVKSIWFNHGMSLLGDVVEMITNVGDKNLRVITSHLPGYAVPKSSDAIFVEPQETAFMDGGSYVDWCVATAQRHGVDLFVPSRAVITIAAQVERFRDAGIKVSLPGSEEVMQAIQHKHRLYERLRATPVPIPDCRIVNTLSELQTAYSELRNRHDAVCFKPDTGVFGHGFRRIVENGSAYERLMKGGPYTATSEIGLDEISMIFGGLPYFDDLIVMPYLTGLERSVDCIAHEGRLVACIIRLKSGHDVQVIEKNDLIETYIDQIAQSLSLSGMFNVQFKDHAGTPYLLEINARASGGLHKACQATGFALPYWAVRLALDLSQPKDVPEPRSGMTIVRRKTYEIVE